MNGEQVIENGVIVTDGKHIKAVGSKDSVTIPKGAEVIDVTGKTIIPGNVLMPMLMVRKPVMK